MQEIMNIIGFITQWMGLFLGRFEAYMQNLMAITMEYLTAIIQGIYLMVDQAIDSITGMVGGMVQAIEAAITGFVDTLAFHLERLWDKIVEVTINVIHKISAFVENAIARINLLIDTAVSAIANVVNTIINAVQTVLSNVLMKTENVLSVILQTIGKQVEQQMSFGERLWDELSERLSTGLDTLIGGAESLVTQIGEKLGDVKEGFKEAAAELVAKAAGIDEETFKPIRDVLKGLFADTVEYASPEETQAATTSLLRLATEGDPSKIKQFISGQYWELAPLKSRFWNGVMSVFLLALSLVPLIMGATSAQAEVLLKDFRKAYPYQVLSPADVTGAWRRGLMGTDVATEMIQSQGFSKELAQTILELSEIVPPEMDLFTMYHRNLISDTELRNGLFEKGVKEEMVDPLIQASYVLPPVSDIITMAVREVFTPAVAERFGQYEDFPQPFAEEAEKQGLTTEWARRYWAAHWALPSPQQGFEMLHRGVIGEEDLLLLLKSLDVMPFWRDRLTKIAYAPFTRVDVRRMHKVGVLDEKAVKQAYTDLGYNNEKASMLTEFVLRLNAPKVADDALELEGLSRAAILNFYSDGLLDRIRTKELLINLGYSDEAAEIYIQSKDIDEERRERQEEITFIIEMAKAGSITFENAHDQLNALGLEEGEIKKTIIKLMRAEKTQTKLPSRSEAERMVKARLLPLEGYKELLERLGYAKKWRDAYVGLLTEEKADG